MPSKIVEIERDYKKDVLLGIAVGDAMGVPFEFLKSNEISISAGAEMIGFGSHNQEPGTFSDDSSMTFCTAEALIDTFDINRIATNFLSWKNQNYWTASNEVFDIGNTSLLALNRLEQGVSPYFSGESDEMSNGNGSLMRILPLVFTIQHLPIEKRYSITKAVSGITHAHIRSVMACFYYLEFARLIIEGKEKKIICALLSNELQAFFESQTETKKELAHFDRIFNGGFLNRFDVNDINSTGYVIDTLEAALYSFLKFNRYEMIVIQAIQLGNDTDTIASIAGGLAALYYGNQTIPVNWLNQLKRKEDIIDLANRWNYN